ncbi:predicted protein [Sclerotinia sclerotiorum 1980 UF-70]|uniref:Uncharacterized protein n=1 Tax=Sclerotinia sclerotiorum (strain ATCC 18683 / 1980 / Ss-1) TaxID=665079 RepID=A7EBI9_SCLS1|nr:predicted protein [Sclerotinia sclerotiorum 1980 UF-70]EDN99817.1 predicted protein [Sclerotinia sclerotiorum 1980 UF-70]
MQAAKLDGAYQRGSSVLDLTRSVQYKNLLCAVPEFAAYCQYPGCMKQPLVKAHVQVKVNEN